MIDDINGTLISTLASREDTLSEMEFESKSVNGTEAALRLADEHSKSLIEVVVLTLIACTPVSK